MNLLKNIFSTMGTEIVLKIIGAFTTILIVRMLSVDEYGQFTLFLAITNAVVAFSAFGMPQSVIFHIGKKKIASTDLLKVLTLLWLLIVVISCMLFLFLRSDFLPHETVRNLIIFITPYFLIKLLDYFLLSFLRGYNKFFFFNLKRLLDALLLALLLLILFQIKLVNLKNIIVIHIFLNFFSTLFLYIYLFFSRKKYNVVENENLFKISKQLIKFGLKSYLQMLVGTLNYQISIFVLAIFLNTTEIAIYSIALTFASLLWFVPNTIGVVLLPTLASLDDETRIHETTAYIYRNVINITAIGSVCFAIIGYWFVPFFYGDEYTLSVIPMLILLPGIIGMTMFKVLTRNFTSRNKQQVSIKLALFVLILNNILNLILVPFYSVTGAAIASSTAFVFAGILITNSFMSDSGFKLKEVMVIGQTDLQVYKDILTRVLKRK